MLRRCGLFLLVSCGLSSIDVCVSSVGMSVGVTSVGVTAGLLRGRGVGVGLGGKSGLVCVWCKSGCRNFVSMSLVLSMLLTPPILILCSR